MNSSSCFRQFSHSCFSLPLLVSFFHRSSTSSYFFIEFSSPLALWQTFPRWPFLSPLFLSSSFLHGHRRGREKTLAPRQTHRQAHSPRKKRKRGREREKKRETERERREGKRDRRCSLCIRDDGRQCVRERERERERRTTATASGAYPSTSTSQPLLKLGAFDLGR